jgi:probable HAF family extracellular repeat protein
MTNIGPTIEGELGRSINKAGQIVTAGGFFYSNGALTNIGSLGGGDTYVANPSDMNGAGQITGYSAIAGTGNTPTHAFLYSNGVMTDIGPLDGQSTGNAISASGQITGWAYFGGTTPHAFLYSNGVMQDLGTLGGTESHGIGIDAYGQVVGNSATASGVTHAFMYSNGQTVDLNTLIDPNSPLAPYVTLNNASRVTNTGYILANGTDSRTGYFVSFVLTPNPTIPTVTPAIAGTLGENGWYVSATTLSWTITGYPTPTTSGCGTVSVPDTKGKTYTCTATNSSGSASGSVTMKKDTVPPQVTIKIPVKGKTYALNEKVLASYTCLDITSGVAACSGTVKDGAAVNTSTKGTKTFEVIGIDKAGNKTTDFVLYTVK